MQTSVEQRRYTFLDQLCLHFDQAFKTLSNTPKHTGKAYPAHGDDREIRDSEKQIRQSAGLMRVNHAGEVCAQALYHGQAIVSDSAAVHEKMREAATEEGDHLLWCKMRLDELGSHTSYLNPLWYLMSFGIGALAGYIGDEWSLGFVVETERQVIKHLATHMTLLPKYDQRSATILQQMEQDEAKHRDEAIAAGARELPTWVKGMMGVVSKVMVKVSYWV